MITILILAAVGVAAVAMQFGDRTDWLKRAVSWPKDQGNEIVTNSGVPTESPVPGSPLPAEPTARPQPDMTPASAQAGRQGSLALADSVPSPEPKAQVAGAQDVEVTAETGASERVIIMAGAAVIMGGWGMATARRFS